MGPRMRSAAVYAGMPLLLGMVVATLRLPAVGGALPMGASWGWDPALTLLHAAGSAVLAVACLGIAVTLAWIVRRSTERAPFRTLLTAASVCIFGAALARFAELWAIWHPLPWTTAVAKLGEALGIGATAIALPLVAPRVVRLLRADLVAAARRRALQRRRVLLGEAQAARHEAELAAAARDERSAMLRAVIDGTADIIFVCDADGRLAMGNPALLRLFGRPPEQLLGTRARDVVGADTALAVEEADRRVMSSGETEVLEETLVMPGGTRTFLVTRSPQRDAAGRVVGVLGIGTDVTERKEAERQREALLRIAERARADAEAASRAKDEFLAILSHELRSPLAATLGWVALLKRGLLDPPRVREAAERIERSVRLQTELVNDLLDVSRIVSRKLAIVREPVALHAVVEQAVDALRPAAEAKGLRVEAVLRPLPAPVVGDARRLQQITSNLLSNAVKFTSAGGLVRVTLTADGDDAVLVVADSGQGIRADFLPHLFHRFTQADASTTRAQGGLGLGLFLVHHLVAEHGGCVVATSPGEGRGATFTVRLPLARHRTVAVAPEVEVRAPAALAGLRVLLVDDDEDTRRALGIALTAAGADVHTAASAREALALFVHARPAVVVSDLGMPGEDGYWLVRRVRALGGGAEVPMVALTGFAGRQDVERTQAAGFTAHVAKPVEPERLVAIVAEAAATVAREPEAATP